MTVGPGADHKWLYRGVFAGSFINTFHVVNRQYIRLYTVSFPLPLVGLWDVANAAANDTLCKNYI